MSPKLEADAVTPSPLDAEARAESIARTFAGIRSDHPVWLFAYGSLLWNPCFSFAEHRTATLDGYRRAFNFWSVRARGTPEYPGLGLGLEPGGTCNGIAYRLADETRSSDIETIWAREMYSSVYIPKWLPLTSTEGPLTALCFVSNRDHPQYAGGLDMARTANIIARSEGRLGSCRDYLDRTVKALAHHAIADPDMTQLLNQVDGVRNKTRDDTG